MDVLHYPHQVRQNSNRAYAKDTDVRHNHFFVESISISPFGDGPPIPTPRRGWAFFFEIGTHGGAAPGLRDTPSRYPYVSDSGNTLTGFEP